MPNRRKLQNAALFLPIFGAGLLIPPLINIFNVPHLTLGMPLEVLYLFTVWTLLIVATALLSRRLPDDTPAGDRPPRNDERNGEA